MLHPSISGWFPPIGAGSLLPPHFNCPCPWDFINIISSSGAADMEQRAAINNSSLVLAPCLGIHTTRSLLCRFGAVHDPNTSLLLWECVCVIVVLWRCVCVCVCNSSSVKVSVCVSPPQVLSNILCTPLVFVQKNPWSLPSSFFCLAVLISFYFAWYLSFWGQYFV